jgi:carbamate kinase
MKIVIALGGNALPRRGERPMAEAQQRNVELAAEADRVRPLRRGGTPSRRRARLDDSA